MNLFFRVEHNKRSPDCPHTTGRGDKCLYKKFLNGNCVERRESVHEEPATIRKERTKKEPGTARKGRTKERESNIRESSFSREPEVPESRRPNITEIPVRSSNVMVPATPSNKRIEELVPRTSKRLAGQKPESPFTISTVKKLRTKGDETVDNLFSKVKKKEDGKFKENITENRTKSKDESRDYEIQLKEEIQTVPKTERRGKSVKDVPVKSATSKILEPIISKRESFKMQESEREDLKKPIPRESNIASKRTQSKLSPKARIDDKMPDSDLSSDVSTIVQFLKKCTVEEFLNWRVQQTTLSFEKETSRVMDYASKSLWKFMLESEKSPIRK